MYVNIIFKVNIQRRLTSYLILNGIYIRVKSTTMNKINKTETIAYL